MSGQEYVECTCGHDWSGHDEQGCAFVGCGCSDQHAPAPEPADVGTREALAEAEEVLADLLEGADVRNIYATARAILASDWLAADRVAAEKRGEERVANAFVAWAIKNETAEPPLDWTWFGEIARQYSPLHEHYRADREAQR